jgi:heme exporter protein D
MREKAVMMMIVVVVVIMMKRKKRLESFNNKAFRAARITALVLRAFHIILAH